MCLLGFPKNKNKVIGDAIEKGNETFKVKENCKDR